MFTIVILHSRFDIFYILIIKYLYILIFVMYIP